MEVSLVPGVVSGVVSVFLPGSSAVCSCVSVVAVPVLSSVVPDSVARSEERRVGKECRL